MKYKIHITGRAAQDISNTVKYIDHILKNPKAADDLLDNVMYEIYSLEEFPYRIKLVDDSILASWGIRMLPIKNYLAFFVTNEQKKLITVVRFLYAKRSWQSALRNSID